MQDLIQYAMTMSGALYVEVAVLSSVALNLIHLKGKQL